MSQSQLNIKFSSESTTCFVGNLSFYTEADALRAIFEDCGEIKDVRVAKD